MAENEKLTILCLMSILMEETDREHTLNADALCSLLDSRYGVTCSRKTVYRDIDRLKEYGLDIGQIKGSNPGYYIAKRDFELAELKLLVDAVQSSKFITVSKSEELIRKLSRLTSRENAKQLNRQIFIYNRPKTGNETIYANVDVIHEAINANRQVSFSYCEWTVRKELRERKDGKIYQVSPWSLTWDDENYYLVAYDAKADKIKHYRVDKMEKIKLLSDKREGREQFIGFDLAAFAKKTFGMYGGEDARVTLYCENHLAGVIIDRFGKEVMMIPKGKDHFSVSVLVAVSPQFFGWITGVGPGIRIDGPEYVREHYTEYLADIAANYERDEEKET